MTRTLTALGLAVAISAGGALAAPDLVPVRSGGDAAIEVKLCDDETTTQVAANTPKTRAEGQKIADALMSQWQRKHPDAANTHPETYPKFQPQLGRVALLRDMINWCIEHPVRGKALPSDDPRMRALEAYILAQRRGKTLDYGKH